MTKLPETLSILAPDSFRQKLSRRSLLQIGGAAAGLAVISACGGGSDEGSGGSSTSTDTTDDASASGGSSAPAGDSILGDYSSVINKATGDLAMYTWGDYNDPEIVGALAESELGVTMKVDFYASNEELITKLEASQGTSGFDIVVPTGAYIPQMVQKGLLQKLDKAKIPNFANIDPVYTGRDWDPGDEYGVCKNWGSTGWMWNTKATGVDSIATWQDFIDVAGNQASGQTSVLDTAPNLAGIYFWANGINWTTEKVEDLDAYERFIIEFAPHIKAFDSYPSTKIAEGAYTLSQACNGDARQAFVRIADAGGDPTEWKWALGSPATEIWMDLYSIADRRAESRRSARLDQLAVDPGDFDQGSQLPRLQQRNEDHRRVARRTRTRPHRRRHDLLLRSSGSDDADRRRQHVSGASHRHPQQGQGRGRRLIAGAHAECGLLAGPRHSRSSGTPRSSSLPILFIVLYSFGTKNPVSTSGVPVDLGSWTLDNYRDAFSDVFFKTFKATIRIAVTATVLCALIGFPVAYFLAFRIAEKWRALLLALIIVPSFTSFLIRTLAWRIPLAPNGTLSKWLQDLSILDGPIQLLETQTAVQIALVYNYLGFMILPLFVALDRIEPGLREASKDLGAGRWATFRQVTFPLAAPGIAAGVMLTFIPMCGDFVTAAVLGGAKGNMVGSMIDSQFKGAQDWPLGSAMAVMMIGSVLLVLGVGAIAVMVTDAR